MRNVYLLRFGFRVKRSIAGLHFFHGVYWSAIIRELLRGHVPPEYGSKDFLDRMGIYPLPILNGITELSPDDMLYYNLILPVEFKPLLLKSMESLLKNRYREFRFPAYSYIRPGDNVSFAELTCLLSGNSEAEKWVPLDSGYTSREVAALQSSRELTLVLHNPLRMHRPNKSKERPWLDARYWDTSFFLSRLNECLLAGIPQSNLDKVRALERGLAWIDVHDADLPLGGVCGGLKLEVPDNPALRKMLVEGQYTGLGKNRSLGMGFYYLAESTMNPLFQCPAQAHTLLAQAARPKLLAATFEALDNDSSGPDGLTAADLKLNKDEYLSSLQLSLQKGCYTPGPVKQFKLVNELGKERTIETRNIMERHLLKALYEVLYQATDEQQDFCVYAYRKGRGYLDAVRAVVRGFKQGFQCGLAADIEAYFDSISPSVLELQMLGLLGSDPILALVNKVIHLRPLGLEQGNPLSPLLANLYLLPLDRELKRTGFHYVRYADDFVLLDKSNPDAERLSSLIHEVLAPLKLRLGRAKTQAFTPQEEITFLGCRINGNGFVQLAELEADENDTDNAEEIETAGGGCILPDLMQGIPVYVTSRETVVRCTDSELLIESGEDTLRVSWKMVSRIVVIGRPRISSGTIYRALILQKPVVFLSVMGKPIGAFYPKYKISAPKDMFSSTNLSFEQFELSFIRAIAAAKLNNQYVLLRDRKIEATDIKDLQLQCGNSDDPEVIRGYEGAGAAIYWKHYAQLINDFDFQGRKYHPSPDPVNAMLSLGYTILYNRVAESLIAAGLSPWEGMFHARHGSHYALASDMMEPYRFLVDRIVLALTNRQQITPDDFLITEGSKGVFCRLESHGFAKYINEFEHTMHNRITTADGNKRTWSEMIDLASRQLVNCLRIGIPYTAYKHQK